MILQAPGQPLGDLHLVLLHDVDSQLQNIHGQWIDVATNGTAEVPAARYRHSLTAVGTNTFILFGGFNGTNFLGDTWRLQLLLADDSAQPVTASVRAVSNGTV
eukprot:SAG31_NODE_3212_length_4544_cov_1.849719_3_plen_103_part_00